MIDDRMHTRSRSVLTVAVGLGWLVGLLLWWALRSEDLTVAQNFAVTLVSMLTVGGLLLAINWGEGLGGLMGFRRRDGVAVLVITGLGLGMAYLLWGPWKDAGICGSAVVVIAVAIVGAALTAHMWIWRVMKWSVRTEVTVEVVAEGLPEASEDVMEDANEPSREDDD